MQNIKQLSIGVDRPRHVASIDVNPKTTESKLNDPQLIKIGKNERGPDSNSEILNRMPSLESNIFLLVQNIKQLSIGIDRPKHAASIDINPKTTESKLNDPQLIKIGTNELDLLHIIAVSCYNRDTFQSDFNAIVNYFLTIYFK